MPPTYLGDEASHTISNSHVPDGQALPQWSAAQLPAPSRQNYLVQANGGFHNQEMNGMPRMPQRRPLTVDEALQYSPFTSIVPFDSSILSHPSGDFPSSNRIGLGPNDLKRVRQPIELLNASLEQANGRPEYVQQATNAVKTLLDKNRLPEYRFKAPLRPRPVTPTGAQPNARHQDSLRPPGLSQFATMVLNSSNVSYRYPSPISPQLAVSRSDQGQEPAKAAKLVKAVSVQIPRQPITPTTPSHPRTGTPTADAITPKTLATGLQPINESTFASNAALSAIPSATPASSQILRPMVIVPPLPPTSDRKEYRLHEQEPQSQESVNPRKRKRDGYASIKVIIHDPKEVSSVNLRALEELIEEIFEAENSLQSRDSQDDSRSSDLIRLSGDTPILTPAAQVRLDSCLQKTIAQARYAEVPVDHLCRLQSLCESGLQPPPTAKIADEADRWLENIPAIEGGLRCARTILRIMTGGRHERKLYSEEVLEKLLGLVKEVINLYIIPIIESRMPESQKASKKSIATGATDGGLFEFATTHKKTISHLLHITTKVMQLLCELVAKVELPENTINSIEPLVVDLLFGDNASSEKDSVLGIHKFEALRRVAMDIVTEVFARYTDQRTSLYSDIFTSLQRLPVARQHARQYKLGDGKGVQVVCALLVRLVQISGIRSHSRQKARRMQMHGTAKPSDDEDESEPDSGSSENSSESEEGSDTVGKTGNGTACKPSKDLRPHLDEVQTLYLSALKSANVVVRYFISKASTSTKTGDEKHRQLLDMFVEDLLTLLTYPEWSAAELILQSFVTQLNELIGSDKSTAPAKNMALELFGIMGCAITDITASAQTQTRNLETDESKLSNQLVNLMDDYTSNSLEEDELLSWTGPYRVVMESLQSHDRDDNQIRTASLFLLTNWSRIVFRGNRQSSEMESSPKKVVRESSTALKLSQMLSATRWTTAEEFAVPTHGQSRLAYSILTLNMGFCRTFGHILKVLLDSIGSDQITVRTRSLKSITQMLEKDPKILDRAPQVIKLIINCVSDKSAMVRDSALALVGKCTSLKPSLDLDVCKCLLACTNDDAVGVRKRSMKLLKDVYFRNTRKDLKVIIAESIFLRVKDLDDGVSELSRQSFEELWLSPGLVDGSAKAEVFMKDQVILVAKVVQRGEYAISALSTLLRHALSSKSKTVELNTKICQAVVAKAFEVVVGNEEEALDDLKQPHILQMLTVFAKASPSLFTKSQVSHLQPYIKSLASSEELNLFRSVVIILRCVLPTFSTLQHDTLKQIQDDLLKNVSKLAKLELNEVVACLWTINCELHNVDRLVNLTISVLTKLHQLQAVDYTRDEEQQKLSQLKRFILLASHFGKHCNFEPQVEKFKKSLSSFNKDSVAGHIINSILPFTSAKQPLSLRCVAFDGLGMLCESWPKHFNGKDIAPVFLKVLRQDDPAIQKIVLGSFRDFFSGQDKGPPDADTSSNDLEINLANKIGASMIASDSDSAAALIAQQFLTDILRIALASQDSYALTATEVIASISRQGLVHPKECGPALVALETSTNSKIAELAFQEHRNVHQQHESMFEREYMRATEAAFNYQRDVVQDTSGAVGQPFRAKLHAMFEVVKTSKGKYQSKFISLFCAKIDFDLPKLLPQDAGDKHLEFSRFIMENLAFFEYGRVEDLKCAVSSMEKVAAGTGAGVAHAINTEILKLNLESLTQPDSVAEAVPNANPVQVNGTTESDPGLKAPMQPIMPSVDLVRLRQLATASLILSLLWEARTYLRRLYVLPASNANTNTLGQRGRPLTNKDTSKPPTKVHGITGDKLVTTISTKLATVFTSEEAMVEQCKAFAELMAIDDEVKVADREEEVELGEKDEDAEENETVNENGVSGAKRKRKSMGGGGGKRGRPSLGKKRNSKAHLDEDSD